LPRLRRWTSSGHKMCARREHVGKVGLPCAARCRPGCPCHVRRRGLCRSIPVAM
jgi:hypothetical protein